MVEALAGHENAPSCECDDEYEQTQHCGLALREAAIQLYKTSTELLTEYRCSATGRVAARATQRTLCSRTVSVMLFVRRVIMMNMTFRGTKRKMSASCLSITLMQHAEAGLRTMTTTRLSLYSTLSPAICLEAILRSQPRYI